MESIFKSIAFIEENIYEPITIHEIAMEAQYSTYHFCRIFRSLVGDSPKEYLRKRRLTIAAERIVKEDTSILDIALDFQFGSHAAFTRSFKQVFKVSPKQYREKADPYRLMYKDQFSPHMLHHLQNRLEMEPEIVNRSEMKVVGTPHQYQEEDLDVGPFWSDFQHKVNQIANRVGSDAFGIYEEYVESEDGVGFSYICCVEVSSFDDVPEGMISRVVPEQMYAVFRHKGSLSLLPETLKYIWGSWLPKSNYEYVEKPDFELYSPGIRPEDPDHILFLHIPVSIKS